MKNKILAVCSILLLLMGASCKKQENLNQEKIENTIQKTDLIGTWTIFKTEITGPTKKGMTTVMDSSANLKQYISDYKFSKSELQVENIRTKYEIKDADNKTFLVFKSFSEQYNFKISHEKKLLKIEMIDSNLNPNRITVHYYKKTNNETF